MDVLPVASGSVGSGSIVSGELDKENVTKPGKWTGDAEGSSSRMRSSGAAHLRLPAPAETSVSFNGVLALYPPLLLKSPTVHHDKGGKKREAGAVLSNALSTVEGGSKSSNSKQGSSALPENFKVPLDRIYAGTQEFSLEELRALRYPVVYNPRPPAVNERE
ncbi:unnamed protein product [Cyprideis torosa]|uniref:Uncharacterized protein n=1 Tax=Cyprideis torosa TaxID=163714 RepID=A0A7R8WPC0_9CRUS|nr:unnamed protein product [Cyprideis torosa]CAG0904926.1 unnamed protein product [Cyprideis torosa]